MADESTHSNRIPPWIFLYGQRCLWDDVVKYLCNSIYSVCFPAQFVMTKALIIASDAYRQQSMDIFILQMVAKNLIAFGFSYFVNSWVTERGAGNVFMVFGIISACIFVTNVPMCKYLTLETRLYINSCC